MFDFKSFIHLSNIFNHWATSADTKKRELGRNEI